MNKPDSLKIRSQVESADSEVTGQFVQLHGESFYQISNSHSMSEFFMSLASASDHWMFISSRGGLSAGRCDSDHVLFPYYSADKISDLTHCTGSLTIVRVKVGKTIAHWEPFTARVSDESCRSVYKNSLGNKVVLEETNIGLGLRFRYCWSFSHRFGFVRSCEIENLSADTQRIEVLDGIQNIMPFGVGENFQRRFSNLGDAYKKNELVENSRLGLFYLSSIPSDRAEPSEGLRATSVWSCSQAEATLLCNDQIEAFRNGANVETEKDIRGRRGAYLTHRTYELSPQQNRTWALVAEIGLDQTDVANLSQLIESSDIMQNVTDDVADGDARLKKLMAGADAFQNGGNPARNQRHLSNVIFNVMRGGVPRSNYLIHSADFIKHVGAVNNQLFTAHRQKLESLPETLQRQELLQEVAECNDSHLSRIAREYIPLVFSRRHGDPSRPWNKFSIKSHVGDETNTFDYQGNWRDIFQNWEAMAMSYPELLESMVCRFLNASTADGYNPYRVTKTGFEWEVPDPDDPWANIGYWCDHQIIYLAKLLELSNKCFPGRFDELLNQPAFVFANVPYRINNAEDTFADPQNTVVFDDELNREIEGRVDAVGSDGKLLRDKGDQIQTATMGAKLLLPALIKLSNFVPDGGIWLNTQRPEWNDANNALVGSGLSVVTTCYLRRYLAFLKDWFTSSDVESFAVDDDIVVLMNRIQLAISPYVVSSDTVVSPAQRHQVVVDLANAGSDYRQKIYDHGFSGSENQLAFASLNEFLEQCVVLLDATIESNRRNDGLFHSYNLMSLAVPNEVHIERLYEMLEGQVAVLSSGVLSIEEVNTLLDALSSSDLYREDQQSYMLYPDRELARFTEKNLIPTGLLKQAPLLKRMLELGDESIVKQDVMGNCHFNGDFRNANDICYAVAKLADDARYSDVLEGAATQLSSIFENMFCHHQFTGRSGTFFAYEGLGSIYWHMVSKLALAAIDNYVDASEAGAEFEQLNRLRSHVHEIRFGLGAEKNPAIYGAFPGDPYSHTPKHAGAQQPGMTGQVKEDILFRFTELGVRISDGSVKFDPALIQREELQGGSNSLSLPEELGHVEPENVLFLYTLCSVPVAYIQSDRPKIVVSYADDRSEADDALQMTAQQSADLFARTGQLKAIEVHFDAKTLSS